MALGANAGRGVGEPGTASIGRIVLQARTESSRLPGKALLSIADRASAILAAERLGNSGIDVVLATTDRALDDELVRQAEKHAIPVFRGSSTDVQGRFLRACGDLPDAAIVVRATADNPVPDGSLAQELADAARRLDGSGYRCLEPDRDDLPYGLTLEVFPVGALRRSRAEGSAAEELEHVTMTLRARASGSWRPVGLPAGLSHLRCTLDNPDDYEPIVSLFAQADDPIGASWRGLCEMLAGAA